MQTARLLTCNLLLSCLALVGCAEDWQTETHPASGRITVNGQPAAGALVQLYPADEKVDERNSRPWGVVGDDGSYSLSTYEQGDGAPAGQYVLTLTWPWDVTKPSLECRLNHAYSTPARSSWRVTITEGDNQLAPVAITGAKVLSKEQAGPAGEVPPGPGMGP